MADICTKCGVDREDVICDCEVVVDRAALSALILLMLRAQGIVQMAAKVDAFSGQRADLAQLVEDLITARNTLTRVL